MNARATSFATPQDLRNYIKCRDNGGSPNYCLNKGDNGEGCWGDETWDVSGVPMCALPVEEMIAKWGSKRNARGKKVKIIFKKALTVIAELRDQGPTGVVDLNPAALKAAGLPFNTELNAPVEWFWSDEQG